MNFYISFLNHIKATPSAQSFVHFCTRTETNFHMKERVLGLALNELSKLLGNSYMKLKASYGKLLKLYSPLRHFTTKRLIERQPYLERLF